jgi:integrase/recombinase XerD
MFSANRAGRLTAELYEILSGKESQKTPVRKAAKDWLDATEGSMAASTHRKYRKLADTFLEYLNATESAPLLSEVHTDLIRSFLIAKRKTLAASTLNVYRKILTVFFYWCIENGYLTENPMRPIKKFKDAAGPANERRPFTVEEIKLMFDKAPNEFWRYMVVAGTYTGLRMGDLICLPWGAIDLPARQMTVKTRKTGARVMIPIRGALHAILETLRARVKRPHGSDPVWPNQAEHYHAKGAGQFSNEFYADVLVPCGLATARPNKKKAKEGRAVKRDTGGVSFHCLRHSFITFLKSAGGNQAVAKELAGHSSDLVNDAYTHLPAAVLSDAIAQLPEVTK